MRVLDFLAIYIKEMKKEQSESEGKGAQQKNIDSMDIIKGLLKGL